jgi:hypothetical protein
MESTHERQNYKIKHNYHVRCTWDYHHTPNIRIDKTTERRFCYVEGEMWKEIEEKRKKVGNVCKVKLSRVRATIGTV